MFHTKIKLSIPHVEDRVLLHVCCAPCSTAIVECMLENGIRPALFYYNPNIYPVEEYERRKAESIRHARMLNLDFIDADYEHNKWLNAVRGMESEPEQGRRCLTCFKHRLVGTASYAKANGFKIFATTLASSRWKSIEQITEAGNYAASLFKGIAFMAQNWRKGGLSERRNLLLREFGFYNQTYCGCEYSKQLSRPA